MKIWLRTKDKREIFKWHGLSRDEAIFIKIMRDFITTYNYNDKPVLQTRSSKIWSIDFTDNINFRKLVKGEL